MSFPNLQDVMRKRYVTQGELADHLGVTQTTMSLKLNGKAPITVDEALVIKEYLGSRLSLDKLFAEKR